MPARVKITAEGQAAVDALLVSQQAVRELEDNLYAAEFARDAALVAAVRAGVPAERASLALGKSRTYAYHVFNRLGGSRSAALGED